MTWDVLRKTYPHRWVLVEAFEAYTEKGMRILPHLELIADFDADWSAAWGRYRALHAADRSREYYILHTDQPVLEIEVLDSFGRIVSQQAAE